MFQINFPKLSLSFKQLDIQTRPRHNNGRNKIFQILQFFGHRKLNDFLYIAVIQHMQQISGSYGDIPKLRMVSYQILTKPNYSTKPVKFEKPCCSLSFLNRK